MKSEKGVEVWQTAHVDAHGFFQSLQLAAFWCDCFDERNGFLLAEIDCHTALSLFWTLTMWSAAEMLGIVCTLAEQVLWPRGTNQERPIKVTHSFFAKSDEPLRCQKCAVASTSTSTCFDRSSKTSGRSAATAAAAAELEPSASSCDMTSFKSLTETQLEKWGPCNWTIWEPLMRKWELQKGFAKVCKDVLCASFSNLALKFGPGNHWAVLRKHPQCNLAAKFDTRLWRLLWKHECAHMPLQLRMFFVS